MVSERELTEVRDSQKLTKTKVNLIIFKLF